MPDTDSIPPPPVRTSPGLVRSQALAAAARVFSGRPALDPALYPTAAHAADVVDAARTFEAYLLGDDR